MRFLVYYKSTLQKRPIIYYNLSPLIIDLLYTKLLYKSVLLASKNVALRNLALFIIPKSLF